MPNKLYYIRRDTLNKSLLDFYHETDVHVSRMSDIERGKAVPTIQEVETLSKVYGIPGQEFIKHVIDYIGAPCVACQEKYLKDELYACEKCNGSLCEECSSGECEEIYCPSCAKQKQEAPIETEDDFRKREF